MRHIYTCIDIGSDSIKIVVCELYHGRYNLLATSTVKSKGIKKGFDQIESMLGFKIKKVIAIIPSYFAEFNMIKGQIDIKDIVTSEDIIKVLHSSMENYVDATKEMVTIMPIDFGLDNEVTKEPLGKSSTILKTRAVLATAPRKNIYSVVNLLNSLNIEVVDISFGAIGDINTFMDENVANTVSAVVNIGAEKTEVSLYNKGIIVKHGIVNMGSKSVDNYIAYMYKVNL